MTLAEFNALDLDHRCNAIWEWGFFISRSKADGLNRVLYSLNGFFAEMVFQPENNKVIDVVTFEKLPETKQAAYFIKNDNPFVRVV